jgi:hypothetical protein
MDMQAQMQAYADKLRAALDNPIHPWTTTPPTEPGWYWAAIWRPDVDDIREVVRVVSPNGRLLVVMAGTDEVFQLGEFTHWLGPLPIPAPPVDTQAKHD